MNKIITIIKPHEEMFILNDIKYSLVEATCEREDLEDAMEAVAKELLPESLFFEYQKMFLEIKLLRSILRK